MGPQWGGPVMRWSAGDSPVTLLCHRGAGVGTGASIEGLEHDICECLHLSNTVLRTSLVIPAESGRSGIDCMIITGSRD